MMQDQNMMAADVGMEDAGNGGYCIEIRVGGDGSISVSSEPKSAEEYGESPGAQASSIGEAIKMAMDIYENGGDMSAGEDAFAAGFGGVREGE